MRTHPPIHSTSINPTQGNHGSDWGFRFVAEPEYPPQKRLAILQRDERLVRRAAAAMHACMGEEADLEIVRLVNEVSKITLKFG